MRRLKRFTSGHIFEIAGPGHIDVNVNGKKATEELDIAEATEDEVKKLKQNWNNKKLRDKFPIIDNKTK